MKAVVRQPCNNGQCKQRVLPGQANKLGLCHRCYEVAIAVQYLIESGAIKRATEDKEANRRGSGLYLPL